MYPYKDSSANPRDAIQVFETFYERCDKWFTRHEWVYRSEIEAISRIVTICFVEDPRTTLKETRRVLEDYQ
jgi:hypothetical protein